MTDAAEAGMVHLRLIAGAQEAPRVLRVLESSPAVASLVRITGPSLRPPGDLILCDVAREEVSVLVSQLRRSGMGRGGSISIDAVESVISPDARPAALASACECRKLAPTRRSSRSANPSGISSLLSEKVGDAASS